MLKIQFFLNNTDPKIQQLSECQWPTHCPKNILNFRIKTEPLTVEAAADVWAVYECVNYGNVSQIYSGSSTPALTSLVFMQTFSLVLGQCM